MCSHGRVEKHSKTLRAELDSLLTETRQQAILDTLAAWRADPCKPAEGVVALERLAAAGPQPQNFDWPCLETADGSGPSRAPREVGTPFGSEVTPEQELLVRDPGMYQHLDERGSYSQRQVEVVRGTSTSDYSPGQQQPRHQQQYSPQHCQQNARQHEWMPQQHQHHQDDRPHSAVMAALEGFDPERRQKLLQRLETSLHKPAARVD
mmetsp:Transcript_904/g.2574  ORF Transcript_904/g.2574 Transcript_904/m.2574 type:complete len:207 (-) Transcript_904:53-673(-)